MSWTCPTWWLAGTSSFLLPHWWTQLWPHWQEELPNPHWTVSLDHSSVWTDSVVVAASVAITGHAPRLQCMLDVVSSEPVSRGAKMWSCVLSKNIVHLVHAAKACCKHLAAGNAGCVCCCYLEEAGMNSLARGIHQFQVFIRFEAIGVSTGNRLTRSTEALFRMKNKCSALIISVSICFFCFSFVSVLVSEEGDSVCNQMLGHATPTVVPV